MWIQLLTVCYQSSAVRWEKQRENEQQGKQSVVFPSARVECVFICIPLTVVWTEAHPCPQSTSVKQRPWTGLQLGGGRGDVAEIQEERILNSSWFYTSVVLTGRIPGWWPAERNTEAVNGRIFQPKLNCISCRSKILNLKTKKPC